jgi:hypothetical protein
MDIMSKTRILLALPIAGVSALSLAVACSSSAPGAAQTTLDSDAGPKDATPSPVTDGPGPTSYTRIDDMEGTTNRLLWTPPVGFAGTWSTTTEGAQSGSIAPAPGSPSTWSYSPVPTPYETFPGITSAHAARLRTIEPLVNTTGAGMAFAFAQQAPDAGDQSGVPPLPVDLSQYKGITFWAMAAQDPQDTRTMRVRLEDKNTAPWGGACLDGDGGTANCFDGFGVNLELTGTFTRYTIDFSMLAQEDWGFHPVPDVIDLHEVYLMIVEVASPGGASGGSSLSFDVWMDDLYFVNK